MISAVVCDDERLFGESFAAVLRAAGAQACTANTPEELVAMLEGGDVSRVVLSVAFPDDRALEAVRRIHAHWPDARVYGVGDDEEACRAGVRAGAHAILSKKRPLRELVHAVLAGSRAGWPEIRTAPRQQGPHGPSTDRERADYALPARFLTNREREVLHLLVSARSTPGIAGELGISVTTTRGYVQSILAKFGVHSRVEAVAYAIRHAVVQC